MKRKTIIDVEWINYVETISPAQYADLIHRPNTLPPEQRMMLAILEDALRCLLSKKTVTTTQAERYRLEAEHWIFDADPGATLSFVSVCQSLNIDPTYIRNQLTKGSIKTDNLERWRIAAASSPIRKFR